MDSKEGGINMEEILILLGAKDPFEVNGELTPSGAEAYEKLIRLIVNLNMIGAITETVDDCEKYFGEIIRLGF